MVIVAAVVARWQLLSRWLVKDEGNSLLLENESAEIFDKFLDKMDDDLDVTNVFHNATRGNEKF